MAQAVSSVYFTLQVCAHSEHQPPSHRINFSLANPHCVCIGQMWKMPYASKWNNILKIACDLEVMLTLMIMLALKAADGDSSKSNLGVDEHTFGVALVLVSTVLPIPALTMSIFNLCCIEMRRDKSESESSQPTSKDDDDDEKKPLSLSAPISAAAPSQDRTSNNNSKKSPMADTEDIDIETPPTTAARLQQHRATTPPRFAGSPGRRSGSAGDRSTTPTRPRVSAGLAVKAVVKAKRGTVRSPARTGSVGGESPSRPRVRITAKPASTTRPQLEL